MSKQIEIWDRTTHDMADSKFEYNTLEVTAIEKAEQHTYDRDQGITLHLYEHEDTGIFVRDIGKFEAWIATLITR